MKNITIKDIAKHLNISTSTVSRALSDEKNIRKETKEKVLKAAKEMGYKPNPVALNLRYGKSNCIGVLVPEMITPFAHKVVEGIQSILFPQKIKVVVMHTNEDATQERINLQTLEQFCVDGIIICSCNEKKNKEEYIRIEKEGIPIVFCDRTPIHMDASKVVVDDYIKSFFMVEHLIRTGRKKIVYLQGPSYIQNTIERAKGYKDALGKFRIPYDESLFIYGGVTMKDSKNAVEQLLKKQIPFDAIFAFTDTLAIGALNFLQDHQVKIPQEVAIASFSGTELSTIVRPQLTTVEQPLKEMGIESAKLLLEKIHNPNSVNKTVSLSATIKIRESTVTNGS